jgi:hypothetical protein
MGNVISADASVYQCDQCNFCTTRRYQLRWHKANNCAQTSQKTDLRRRNTPASVILTPPPSHDHSDHSHPHDGCSGCDDHDDMWQHEELRMEVEDQVQAYMEAAGEELAPETLAEVSDLLLGVITNGEWEV